MTTSLFSPQTLRRLHRKLAPVLFLPFLLVALTGMVYQVGARSRFIPISDDVSRFIMQLHEGSFLGRGRSLYILLLMLGFIGMGISGILILRRRASQKGLSDRSLHRTLTPFLILPFFATGLTGGLYALGDRLFDWSPTLSRWLMRIHTGDYLGRANILYVLFLGLGLITMVLTGIRMTSLFKYRRAIRSDSVRPDQDAL